MQKARSCCPLMDTGAELHHLRLKRSTQRVQEVDSADSKLLIFETFGIWHEITLNKRWKLPCTWYGLLKTAENNVSETSTLWSQYYFSTQKTGGMPSSTSTVSSLAVLLWPIMARGCCLPVCYMAFMSHTCQLKQTRFVQQRKTYQCNRKKYISSSRILYNNTFRTGKF